MQTQRSNYGGKQNSISIRQSWKRPRPPRLGMQTARELRDARKGDKGQRSQRQTNHHSQTNGPQKVPEIRRWKWIPRCFYYSFISRQKKETERRKQQTSICDYWLRCWKYNELELDMRAEVFFFFLFFSSRRPDCHSRASVSPGVPVSERAHLLYLCQEDVWKNRFHLLHILNNHTPQNSFVLVWLCLRGDTQAGAPFVAQNWCR